MSRTNRVEPVNTGSDGGDITRATVTTTTRMEFVRRVQVVPMSEAVAQLHSDLNQSLAGDVIVSPRIWTGMHRPVTPVAVRGSRRTLWVIGCLFITVGLLALIGVIAGLTIAFGKTNTIGESDIERYDVGDLHYGMDNVNQAEFPSNSYLSSDNQASVQKYLSEQLISEPGYRGLFIDGVLVQQQSTTNGRKRRDTSCSTVFIIRNIQVYFDHCSSCVGARNLALRRSLSNMTAFQQSLNLFINNGSTSQVSTQICSTPNITRLILPVTLSILQAQQINSSLLTTNTYSSTTETKSIFSTYIYSTRPATRSSYKFTSRSISTQKKTTTTTTTFIPIEIPTTIYNDISTVISTIPSEITTDSTSITETSTKQTETSIGFTDLTTTKLSEIDETTSSIDLSTTTEIFEDTTSFADQTTTSNEFEETTYPIELTSSSIESFSTETSSFIMDSTTESEERTSSSFSEETSTIDFAENRTSSGELETTSIDNFEELTSPATLIDNTTSESDLSETTISEEATSSNSSIETQTAATLFDYSTETSTIFDSTTNEIDIDSSSPFFAESTTETSEIQSSTVSSYTEETSLSSVYVPTTMKTITTTAQSSSKPKTSTTNFRRQTTGKISPLLPLRPGVTSSPSKLTSPSMSSFTSTKPGRTRNQTFYSTAFLSPTTRRYGTSLAVTPTNTYRPTSSIRQRRFTTVSPSISTGRTNIRSYTMATSPLASSTQRRGRFRSTTEQFKRTTYIPTSLRPQTTTSTDYQTTFLPTSTLEQFSASLSSTDMFTIESTIATDGYMETSSSSPSIEIDSTTDVFSASTDSDQSIDNLSSTDEYDSTNSPFGISGTSTESLFVTDLTSTVSDEPYITSSSSPATTTTIVSTSGMITISRLLNNLTDQQYLHSSSSSSSSTITASLINAYIESSSITSITIVDSSRQITDEVDNKSTKLLQTLFDSSVPWINRKETSTEDSSRFQASTTTINDLKSSTLSTYEQRSSTNSMQSFEPKISSTSQSHTISSTKINTIDDIPTPSMSSLAGGTVSSSTEHITTLDTFSSTMIAEIISTRLSFDTSVSSLHSKQLLTTVETSTSTSTSTLNIKTSTDLISRSTETEETETNSILSNPTTILPGSSIDTKNSSTSSHFSTFSSFNTNEKDLYTQTVSTMDSQSTVSVRTDILPTTSTQSLLKISSVHSSTTVEIFPTTTESSETDSILTTEVESITILPVTKTTDTLSTTTNIDTQTTTEHISNSHLYSLLSSSKHITLTDSIRSSFVSDISTTTTTDRSTVDSSLYSISKSDTTTTKLLQDKTFATTENPTESSTQSSMSLSTNQVSASTMTNDRTSIFITSHAVESVLTSSIETDATINSVVSTTRSVETTSTSSVHSSTEQTTDIGIVTPSKFTDRSTITFASTNDASFIQQSTTHVNTRIVSEDRTLSAIETTGTASPPSVTDRTLTQISPTASTRSLEITSDQSPSQTATRSVSEIDATSTEHFLLSSEAISNIATVISILTTDDVKTTSRSDADLPSFHTSTFIPFTIGMTSVQTVTITENLAETTTLSSIVEDITKITTQTSLLSQSSTTVDDGLTSTISLKTSTLEPATNDKFRASSFSEDSTDITSLSTLQPATLPSSSVKTLTTDFTEDRTTTNQKHIDGLSTLTSNVANESRKSESTSGSISDHETDQSTYQANIITSENKGTTIDATILTAKTTLSHAVEQTSSSAEHSSRSSSEYTGEAINESSTRSMTVLDQYGASTPTNSETSKSNFMSSVNPETSSQQITTQTSTFLSVESSNSKTLVTTLSIMTMTEIKASLLTSSEQVSNIHTITQTLTTPANDLITTSEVSEDKPSSTPASENKTSTFVSSTVTFDTALSTTRKRSTNELMSKTTPVLSSEADTTSSNTIDTIRSTSIASPSTERLITDTSDVTVVNDRTSEVQTLKVTNAVSTATKTIIYSVKSTIHSADAQGASSSTISSSEPLSYVATTTTILTTTTAQSFLPISSIHSSNIVSSITDATTQYAPSSLKDEHILTTLSLATLNRDSTTVKSSTTTIDRSGTDFIWTTEVESITILPVSKTTDTLSTTTNIDTQTTTEHISNSHLYSLLSSSKHITLTDSITSSFVTDDSTITTADSSVYSTSMSDDTTTKLVQDQTFASTENPTESLSKSSMSLSTNQVSASTMTNDRTSDFITSHTVESVLRSSVETDTNINTVTSNIHFVETTSKPSISQETTSIDVVKGLTSADTTSITFSSTIDASFIQESTTNDNTELVSEERTTSNIQMTGTSLSESMISSHPGRTLTQSSATPSSRSSEMTSNQSLSQTSTISLFEINAASTEHLSLSSEPETNDNLSTISSVADDANVTTLSTRHSMTTNEKSIDRLSTLTSNVADESGAFASTSGGISEHETDQSTYQPNIITSEKIDTTIDATISNMKATLSHAVEQTSSATEHSSRSSSEYIDETINESSTRSMTVEDPYRTSTWTNSESSKTNLMLSVNPETSSHEKATQASTLSSVASNDNNTFFTTLSTVTTTEIKSPLLTSSDQVSNIHTMTQTFMTATHDLTTTSEVSLDKLSSTPETEKETSIVVSSTVAFDTTLSTTEKRSTNALISKSTAILSSEADTTSSHTIDTIRLTSIESPSTEKLITGITDTTVVSSSDVNDRTSTLSTPSITNQPSSFVQTARTSVVSASHSADVQTASSSTSFSSEQVTNVATTTSILTATTAQSFPSLSAGRSSTIAPSISDVTSQYAPTSLKDEHLLSTLSLTTLNIYLTTSKPSTITTDSSETGFLLTTEVESITSSPVGKTMDTLPTTSNINTQTTTEAISNSHLYSLLSSSTKITSTDSIRSSFGTDSSTITTEIATAASSLYSTTKNDETITKLSQDETFLTTENPTKSSTQSSMSLSTNQVSTTNMINDRTSIFITSHAVDPVLTSSIETDATIYSNPSTSQSDQTTSRSSIPSISLQTTNIDAVTRLTSPDTTTITFSSTIDASFIQQASTNDNTKIVSEDRTPPAIETTSTSLSASVISSHTDQPLTQNSVNTNTQSLEITDDQSLSQTSTVSRSESNAASTEHLSLSSESMSNIDTATSTVTTDGIKTTFPSSADLSSFRTSNLIPFTTEKRSTETVTTIENSAKPSAFSSIPSIIDEITTQMFISLDSSTMVNDGFTSTILSQISTSEPATNNELSTSSTRSSMTLYSSTVKTLTTDSTEDETMTNQENTDRLSTLTSIAAEESGASASTSASISDQNTDQSTYQTNKITSEKIDTTIAATFSTMKATLSHTVGQTARSTEGPLHLTSEYTTETIHVSSIQSTKVSDQYQTSTRTNSEPPKIKFMSSVNPETGNYEKVTQASTLSSVPFDDKNTFITTLPTVSTTEIRTRLLTSSDQVSNVHMMKQTLTTPANDLTPTFEVPEDKPSSTTESENKTSMLVSSTVTFHTTLSTTEKPSTNELISKPTVLVSSEADTTISDTIDNIRSTSIESPLTDPLITDSIDMTVLTLTDMNDRTSNLSTPKNTNQLSTTVATITYSVTSTIHSADAQRTSSSTRSSSEQLSDVDTTANILTRTTAQSFLTTASVHSSNVVPSTSDMTPEYAPSSLKDEHVLTTLNRDSTTVKSSTTTIDRSGTDFISTTEVESITILPVSKTTETLSTTTNIDTQTTSEHISNSSLYSLLSSSKQMTSSYVLDSSTITTEISTASSSSSLYSTSKSDETTTKLVQDQTFVTTENPTESSTKSSMSPDTYQKSTTTMPNDRTSIFISSHELDPVLTSSIAHQTSIDSDTSTTQSVESNSRSSIALSTEKTTNIDAVTPLTSPDTTIITFSSTIDASFIQQSTTNDNTEIVSEDRTSSAMQMTSTSISASVISSHADQTLTQNSVTTSTRSLEITGDQSLPQATTTSISEIDATSTEHLPLSSESMPNIDNVTSKLTTNELKTTLRSNAGVTSSRSSNLIPFTTETKSSQTVAVTINSPEPSAFSSIPSKVVEMMTQTSLLSHSSTTADDGLTSTIVSQTSTSEPATNDQLSTISFYADSTNITSLSTHQPSTLPNSSGKPLTTDSTEDRTTTNQENINRLSTVTPNVEDESEASASTSDSISEHETDQSTYQANIITSENKGTTIDATILTAKATLSHAVEPTPSSIDHSSRSSSEYTGETINESSTRSVTVQDPYRTSTRTNSGTSNSNFMSSVNPEASRYEKVTQSSALSSVGSNDNNAFVTTFPTVTMTEIKSPLLTSSDQVSNIHTMTQTSMTASKNVTTTSEVSQDKLLLSTEKYSTNQLLTKPSVMLSSVVDTTSSHTIDIIRSSPIQASTTEQPITDTSDVTLNDVNGGTSKVSTLENTNTASTTVEPAISSATSATNAADVQSASRSTSLPMTTVEGNTRLFTSTSSTTERSTDNDNTEKISQERTSSTIENMNAETIKTTISTSISSPTLNIMASTDLISSSTGIEGTGRNSISSNQITTSTIATMSTATSISSSETLSFISSHFSTFSSVNTNKENFYTATVSTIDSEPTISVTNTYLSINHEDSSSTKPSSERISNSDTSSDVLTTTTAPSFLAISAVHSSNVALLNRDSTTVKTSTATSDSSETNFILTTKLELKTNSSVSTTIDTLSTTTDRNTQITTEDISTSNLYASLSSSKHITSTDSIRSSFVTDISTAATDTSTADSSLYSTLKSDETTTKLVQDQTFVIAENPTESSTQSSISPNTKQISTTLGNIDDEVSTISATTTKIDRTSNLIESHTVEQVLSSSIAHQTTIDSGTSTSQSVETTSKSSVHSSAEESTIVEIFTPSTFPDASTTTSSPTIDTSIIPQTTSDANPETVSQKFIPSVIQTTSTASPSSLISSIKDRTLTQTSDTTSNRNLEITGDQSLAQTTTKALTKIDATSTDYMTLLSSSSEQMSNIVNITPTLSTDDIETTYRSKSNVPSFRTSNLIPLASEMTSAPTTENSDEPQTYSLIASKMNKITTQTSTLSSVESVNNNTLITILSTATTTKIKSLLLTSSEQISNIHIMTQVFPTTTNVPTATSRVSEDRLLSASETEKKPSTLESSTVTFDTTLLTTGEVSTNELISETTTMPSSEADTTSSHTTDNLKSTFIEFSSTQQLITEPSETNNVASTTHSTNVQSTSSTTRTSSEPVSNVDTRTNILPSTSTQSLLTTSVVQSSTVVPSISNVTSQYLLSSLKDDDVLSTVSSSKLNRDSTTVTTSTSSTKTDENDYISTTTDGNVLITTEDLSNSHVYSLLSSSKLITSTGTIASSIIPDISTTTTTKISAVDSSLYSTSKSDTTTTKLSQDETLVTTENPTEWSTQSPISLSTNQVLTTLENMDEVSTTATKNYPTSIFSTTRTVESVLTSSMETDTTIKSVPSTTHSLETASSSSIYSLIEETTNAEIVTPSRFADTSTITVIQMTSTVLPPSTISSITDRTLPKNSVTTSTQSLEATGDQSLSQITTISISEVDATSPEHSPLPSESMPNIGTATPTLTADDIKTTFRSNADLTSSRTSRPIPFTTEMTPVQIVTANKNSAEPSVFSSVLSRVDEMTTETSLLSHSSTTADDGLILTTSSQISPSEHATNDKFSTLSFSADSTDVTSLSTRQPSTLPSSSVRPLTTDLTEDRTTTNQEHINRLLTLTSNVADGRGISVSTGDSIFEHETHQSTYQTNIITSEKIDTTVDVTVTTIGAKLSQAVAQTSSSTEDPSRSSSEYTGEPINESSTRSMTVQDQYQTLTSRNSRTAESDIISSSNPISNNHQITTQTSNLSSVESNSDNTLVTTLSTATATETKAPLLTSSEQVPSIHTMTQTLTTPTTDVSTTSQLYEDKLFSTSENEKKTSTFGKFDTTLLTTSEISPDQLITKTTAVLSSEADTTSSHTMDTIISTPVESSSTDQLITDTSDTTFVSSSDVNDRASKLSSPTNMNKLSTAVQTAKRFVASTTHSNDVQSSSRRLSEQESNVDTRTDSLPSTSPQSLLTTSVIQSSTVVPSISNVTSEHTLSSLKDDNALSTVSFSTLNRDSTTVKTSTPSNKTAETNYISTTTDGNTQTNSEDLSKSDVDPLLSSSKDIASTDSITSSIISDISTTTTTKISTVDSSLYSTLIGDETTTKLSEDRTFVTTESPTQSSTQSSISPDTNQKSTTLENMDEAPTTITRNDRTSIFSTHRTVESDLTSSMETDTTIKSVPSTTHSLQTTSSSSIYSSTEETTNAEIVTPSRFADSSTITVIQMTSTASPPSVISSMTDRTLTQNSVTTSTQSLEITGDQSLSQTATTSVSEVDATSTEHLLLPSLSSQQLSNIDTETSTLTTDDIKSTFSSNADLPTFRTSHFIPFTTEVTPIQAITTNKNPADPSVFSSIPSKVDEMMTQTSLSSHSSTTVDDRLTSTILSQISTSGHPTNDKFSALSFSAGSTDVTSLSTRQPSTLPSSSVRPLTTDLTEDRTTTNQENINRLSTQTSNFVDERGISVSTSDSISGHETHQSTYQTNIILSEKIDTTIDASVTTIGTILSQAVGQTSSSTEYTDEPINESSTRSMTLQDQYQTSTSVSSRPPESDIIPSSNPRSSNHQITTETSTLSLIQAINNDMFITTLSAVTTTGIESALLTSSEQVSNIHTMTQTLTTPTNDVTPTSQVSENKLWSTSEREKKTSTVVTFDTTLSNTERLSTNELISKPTVMLSSKPDTTSSHTIDNIRSSPIQASTTEQPITDTSDVNDRTSKFSRLENANKLSTTVESAFNSVTSATNAPDVQSASSSTILSMATVEGNTHFFTSTLSTTERSADDNSTEKTSQERTSSTIENMNAETITTTISTSSIRARSETSTITTNNILESRSTSSTSSAIEINNDQTISETTIDQSRNGVTMSSARDTAILQTTNIDTSTSETSDNSLFSTLKKSDEASILSNSITSTVKFVPSTTTQSSQSQTNTVSSSELDTTLINSFTTVESVSSSSIIPSASDMTSHDHTITSQTSESALLTPDSTDSIAILSSQNNDNIETTTSNMKDSISSSTSHNLTEVVFSSSNSITQSSQSNSEAETSSPDTKLSTIFNQPSNTVLDQSPFDMTSSVSVSSTVQTSIFFSLETTSLPLVTSTSATSDRIPTVTNDRLSSFKILSSIGNRESTTSAYITDGETLLPFQTTFDSTKEKMDFTSQSILSSEMSSNDLSSFQPEPSITPSSPGLTDSISLGITRLTDLPSTSIQSQKLSSINSDQTFSKTLTSSLSSEETSKEFMSTVALKTSDAIEEVSTNSSKSFVDQSTLISQPGTQITTHLITSDNHISSVPNDMITTATDEQKDESTQLPTILSSSSDHTPLNQVISTKSAILTSLAIQSILLPNEQNIQSTETTSSKLDQSSSLIQSTIISHNQTSTIKSIQNENDFSTIKSSLETLNITSASP